MPIADARAADAECQSQVPCWLLVFYFNAKQSVVKFATVHFSSDKDSFEAHFLFSYFSGSQLEPKIVTSSFRGLDGDVKVCITCYAY